MYKVRNTTDDKDLISIIDDKKKDSTLFCIYNAVRERKDIVFPILCRKNIIRLSIYSKDRSIKITLKVGIENAEVELTSSKNNKPLLDLRIESSHASCGISSLIVNKCIIGNIEASDNTIGIEYLKYTLNEWEQLKRFLECNRFSERCNFIDTIFTTPAEYVGFNLKYLPKIRLKVTGNFGIMNIINNMLDYWDVILNGHVIKGVIKRDSKSALLRANLDRKSTLTMFYIRDRPILHEKIMLLKGIKRKTIENYN